MSSMREKYRGVALLQPPCSTRVKDFNFRVQILLTKGKLQRGFRKHLMVRNHEGLLKMSCLDHYRDNTLRCTMVEIRLTLVKNTLSNGTGNFAFTGQYRELSKMKSGQ